MSYRLWVQPHFGGYNTAIPGSFHPTPLLGAPWVPRMAVGWGLPMVGVTVPGGLCGHQAGQQIGTEAGVGVASFGAMHNRFEGVANRAAVVGSPLESTHFPCSLEVRSPQGQGDGLPLTA